jgi:hypothetical protein
MGEISLTLPQVRQARGLTLEDAERNTRIAKKFLIALEDHNYAIFPAPVYARGFLRSYCRYLGIDPEPQLAELPQGWAAAPPAHTEPVRQTRQVRPPRETRTYQPTEHTPHERNVRLPELGVPSVRLPANLNIGWLIMGLVLAAIIAGGYLYTRGESGLDGLTGGQGQQQEQPETVDLAPLEVLRTTPDGTMASFAGGGLEDSLAFLKERNISYLVIEAADADVPAGTILSQSPAAGARTSEGMIVTLNVSSGPTASTTIRTDCAVLNSAQTRTTAEQSWFQSNCNGGSPSAPATQPTALPNRTSCAQIAGTQYRSDVEMNFYRNNCTTN